MAPSASMGGLPTTPALRMATSSRPKRCEGEIDHRRVRLGLADVAGQRHDGVVGVGPAERVADEVDGDDVEPALGEQLGGGLADARRRARDDGDPLDVSLVAHRRSPFAHPGDNL